MSRMVLAAMRKHSNPSEFVKKFLLPCIKRGAVPARTAQYWRKPLQLPKGNLTSITFYDTHNPQRLCYFQLMRTLLKRGEAGPPKIKLFNELFVKIGAKPLRDDWQQAREISGTIYTKHPEGKVTSEYIVLSHESLKHWQPTMKVEFKGKTYINYGIRHELFQELEKYSRTAEDLNRLGHVFDFLRGKITKEHLVKRLKVEKGFEQPYRMFLGMLGADGRQRIARILQKGLEITPARWLKEREMKEITEKIAEKIAAEYAISKRFAENLALPLVIDCERNRKIVEKLLKDLESFKQKV